MSNLATIKAELQKLLDTANEKTGKADADLTGAVGSLVEGYGTGGSVPKLPACEVVITSETYNEPAEYTSACFKPEYTNSKELTCTISAKAGDWILATVATRDTPTYPTDWELLHESDYVTYADGTAQNMAFLCKQVDTTGTISFTVQQATKTRMFVNLIAVSKIRGFVYHEGSEYRSTELEAEFYVTRPQCAALIWGCSSIGGITWCMEGNEDNAIYVDRLANFIDTSMTDEVHFYHTSTGNTMAIIDCVEVLD